MRARSSAADTNRHFSSQSFSSTPEPVSLPGALPGYRLHPVLRQSSDPRNREAAVAAGQFQVPGLTVAVFVQPQQVRR